MSNQDQKKEIIKTKSRHGGKESAQFQIGEIIGRGAFGAVYKGFNISTGEFVAIKRISLTKIPKDELKSTMMEIDLLMKLHHENIVKYIGFSKSREYLNIVLEYIENGSLQNIMKKFGNFPENLVAKYMFQTLKGLEYLHKQGVIHRDIKGANILSTKESMIKLTDFGIATKLGESDQTGNALGTPFWMAPEIIELTPATPACDIWSLGCTAIELLTGKPPYFDLTQMQALYRIVQDDMPPLPDGISPELKDFLTQCFQKDPFLRVSATRLLEHDWIQSAVNENYQSEKQKKRHRRKRHHKKKSHSSRRNKLEQPQQLAPDNDDDFELDLSQSGDDLKLKLEQKQKPPPPKITNIKPQDVKLSPLQPTKSKIINKFAENDLDDFFDDLEGDFFESKKPDEGNTKPSPLKNHLSKRYFNANLGVSVPELMLEETQNNLQKFAEKTNFDEDFVDDFDNFDTQKLSKPKLTPQKETVKFPALEDDKEDVNLFEKLNKFKEDKNDNVVEELVFDDDDDDDDEDPEDLKARDRQTKLSNDILNLISKLQPEEKPQTILSVCNDLYEIFQNNPETKNYLITHHGVIPIMEMLELSNTEVLQTILKVVNKIIENNNVIQENLCLIGGIPAIMRFCSNEFSSDIREQAAQFVHEMCHTSRMTLQMFIACRGLPVLVDLLGIDYQKQKEIIFNTIIDIEAVFQLKSPTPKNDFCRLFAKGGLLLPLVRVLRKLNSDFLSSSGQKVQPKIVKRSNRKKSNKKSVELSQVVSDDILNSILKDETKQKFFNFENKIVDLFLLFSQADSAVKRQFAKIKVLKKIMKVLPELPDQIVAKMLKSIKNISLDPNTLYGLEKSFAIATLIPFLARRDGNKTLLGEIHNQVLTTLYHLCRVNRNRQEEAAAQGIIPHLKEFIRENSPLKQFALQIICGMSHASKTTRNHLWKNDGINFYMELMNLPYWNTIALDSISVWLVHDKHRVENALLQKNHIQTLISLFDSTNESSLKSMLESFERILRSKKINKLLGELGLVEKIIKSLSHPDAQVRINLLKMLFLLYQHHNNPSKMISDYNLLEIIKDLKEKDNGVIVTDMASRFLNAANSNSIL
ncbi:mtk1/mekk4 [Anaeramoeba ignava]|uniref:non-specific serine/threonine protein kinase n=1 Tax=Anaeramoeba ignava TaxID=1746090 RepID=A0A9Q0LF47_ANAIG|nr:mtk1/mekk4 [Anaeramoeba ignava]